MLLSKKWLQQYLPEGITLSEDELRERVTFSLAEVEEIHTIGSDLKKIVVGEIKKIKPHPKSSKLHIAIVDIGSRNKRSIVCGASNTFEGAKVPVAVPGGSVLNPEQKLGEQDVYEIKEVEIKNVKSSGMLCSQKELGISDDHEGIWILPDEVKVGEDFLELITDTVFEIENKSLTNRPDCFSHLGIARELSAILKIPFDYKESEETLIPTKTLPLVVKVDNKELCKRYTAIAIQGIKISPSPLWLQLKLLVTGVRPVNNIVDATNYVMLDLGQPLHAFDYNKLSTPRIIVRTAKKGEKIVTLDGEERELESTHLLITDPKKPVAIGGIMGGENTEVDENTKDIIIEAANFEMFNIRRSTRQLGIRSEASMRFEKGLDPHITLSALKRVVELIHEIAGGEIASEVIDIFHDQEESKIIEFETTEVQRLLGIEPSKEQIVNALESLELEVKSPESSATKVQVKIPTFRRDLHIKEDLLEEVARIYGYDKFTPTLPLKDLKAAKANQKRSFRRKVKQTLSALGFDEIYTYSFTGEEQYKNSLLNIKDCIKLKNSISPELGFMRNSLVPNLLEKVQPNLANFDEVAFYEVSRIYDKAKDSDSLHKQPNNVAGVLCNSMKDKELFFDLKGKVTALLDTINVGSVDLKKSTNIEYLHPSQQATIHIGNTEVGHIGLLHPQAAKNWDIEKNCALFVLDFDELFQNIETAKKYKRVSKYPQVKRDLSFWIGKGTIVGDVLNSLKEVDTKYVTDIIITDVYEKDSKNEKKSITINITLQSKHETLTEKEINTEIKDITKVITKLGGKLRK
ncbi:phenylalanine--tRNA ligase subunit beta [Patescibacteria group bacterium]